MPSVLPKKIKIFYCYAHEDGTLRDELEKQLSPLRRLKYITGWFDRNIQAGTDWQHEIETQMNDANIILLLVSPDFVASDYCYSEQMQIALERHRTGKAYVVPIILRPIHWQDTPLGELSVLPPGGKPVTQWADPEAALWNVAEGIRALVRDLLAKETLSHQETFILAPSLVDQNMQSQLTTPSQLSLPLNQPSSSVQKAHLIIGGYPSPLTQAVLAPPSTGIAAPSDQLSSPTHQVTLQNTPQNIHQLAATHHMGTPIAEYRIKPRIVKVNAGGICVLLLVGLLAFGPITNSAATSSWGIFSALVVGLLVFLLICLFLGLELWRPMRAYFNRSKQLIICTEGAIQIENGKAEVIHWDQVVAFWGNRAQHYFLGIIPTGATSLYAILRADGKDFRFNEDFPEIEDIGDTICREVTSYLLPKALSAYNSGDSIPFGEISISNQGLGFKKKMYHWNQIESIQILDIGIRLKEKGRWPKLLTSSTAVPNIPVLEQLVDHVFNPPSKPTPGNP